MTESGVLHPPKDQDIVVVGASGDLAARKLLPALYNLQGENLLPKKCRIVGTAIADWSDEQFRDHARAAVTENSRTGIDTNTFNAFASRLSFVPQKPGDVDLKPLKPVLGNEERLIYLAVPSSAFVPLIHGVQDAGLAPGTSIIIEKPFGHDLHSAIALDDELHSVLPEERIFRIDHYLGKETVQNLLVFRFGNAIFERVWNRDAIAQVEITVAEELGVEQRGKFYEETGAIRDIVQNHLFQVLAVMGMDAPTSFTPEAIRNEKVKVIGALQPVRAEDVVRGQYTAGTVSGEKVAGYRQEPGVNPQSNTETFVAMRLHVDTWRWSGVPFYLRTGKRLAIRDTRIVITFRDVPLHLFHGTAISKVDRNQLIVRIQPNEGIAVTFVAKQPGPEVSTQEVKMDFTYENSFKTSPPEAYERLLHDALMGDHTLFIRQDEVEKGWAAVQPLLEDLPPIEMYEAGSWGPQAADRIVHPGRWHNAGAAP